MYKLRLCDIINLTENQQRKMAVERLTIGQMAEMNHVTKKTLMLYHKHGLLIPEEVDPLTGYRYYTLDQCSTLDMIQRLKQTGLSLTEIKEIADRRDVSYMQSMVMQQIARMRQSMAELEMSLSTARELVKTCSTYQNKPPCGEISLEYIERRRVLYYEISPYTVQKRWEEDPGLGNWERGLRAIKQQMLAEGYPLALFHNVGCVISQESLLDPQRNFVCTGGYIFCPGPVGGREKWLPGGYCMCTVIDHMFDEEGNHLENMHANRLMDAIEEQGYTVRGDYYSESIAETPAFFYRGRDMMMRLLIPVEVSNPEISRYYRRNEFQ